MLFVPLSCDCEVEGIEMGLVGTWKGVSFLFFVVINYLGDFVLAQW